MTTRPYAEGLNQGAELAFVVLAITLVLLALVWLRRRQRQSSMDVEIDQDEPTVNAQRNALTSWLQEKRIVMAMVRTQTASVAELQVTLLAVPGMSATQLASTCKSLLRSKDVRRIIATHLVEKEGLNRMQALKGLLEWADVEPMVVRH